MVAYWPGLKSSFCSGLIRIDQRSGAWSRRHVIRAFWYLSVAAAIAPTGCIGPSPRKEYNRTGGALLGMLLEHSGLSTCVSQARPQPGKPCRASNRAAGNQVLIFAEQV